MKVTNTTGFFYTLMLASDVLPQVPSLCCYVRTEVTLESRLNSFMLDVVVLLQSGTIWRLKVALFTFVPNALMLHSLVLPQFCPLSCGITALVTK